MIRSLNDGLNLEAHVQENLVLELDPREILGKQVKQLRREGITPVHIYGPATAPRALQCQTKTLAKIVAQAGKDGLIQMSVAGEKGKQQAVIGEVQREWTTGELLHVDFLVR